MRGVELIRMMVTFSGSLLKRCAVASVAAVSWMTPRGRALQSMENLPTCASFHFRPAVRVPYRVAGRVLEDHTVYTMSKKISTEVPKRKGIPGSKKVSTSLLLDLIPDLKNPNIVKHTTY